MVYNDISIDITSSYTKDFFLYSCKLLLVTVVAFLWFVGNCNTIRVVFVMLLCRIRPHQPQFPDDIQTNQPIVSSEGNFVVHPVFVNLLK